MQEHKRSERAASGGAVVSAHTDRYIYSMLPPEDTWPVFDYTGENLPRYPDYMNVTDILLGGALAEGLGDKPAFHFEEETWSYGKLIDTVDRIARVLVEDYGLEPGNRVLLRSGNSPMLAACWLAVLKVGGICVASMPLLKAEEIVFILDRVRVRFALCEESLADELEKAQVLSETLERTALFTPRGDGDAELDRAIRNKAGGLPALHTAAEDIAIISFTSGTTGHPKATVNCHRDLVAISDCYPRVFSVLPDDVICGSPSMAFTYGLAVFLVYPLRYRATVVYVPRPIPEKVLEAIERHGVTSLYSVPTSYRQLLDAMEGFDISSVRKCSSSGENLQTPLFEAWHERTGVKLVNGFGATELICTVLSETMDVGRIGSTGRPIPGYTMRLVDEDGNALPQDAAGRLAIRGPTGCRYLDDIENQRAFVHDGWNLTSDLFVRDSDGYYWYVDRSDDMIVSAGYNISPQEVERALLEHPLVHECAVVGVNDAKRGKLVRACVVLHDHGDASTTTVAALQEFVKRRIAPYKYPRDIRFLAELPKTHTGKIQRQKLRDV
ncbi:MAG: AMP-binding protein [Gammaproteobacteria bacterium]|nr:AMP-binding protein [Gammaproteobacteria bacterium]MDH4255397.1 AMP-binding protein [Gammaproteobacteria bacterium]